MERTVIWTGGACANMVKAVFVDYMGTTVDERSWEMAEIVRHICKNSSLGEPKEVQQFITNNGLPYMEQALRNNGLKAAGVVSADTVRAYKPHREVFEEALRLSGCGPDETIHIGDSCDTDVIGARSAGIKPVLLLRGRARQHDGVDAVDDLTQALDLVAAKQ